MAANLVQRMPLDGDNIFDERDDQCDDESLFGSPPPSPGTGRTLSLALPSGGLDSEQNVGTLALPGSHNPSKLPIDSAVSDARHHPFETQPPRVSTPEQATTSRTTSLAPAVTDLVTGSRPSRSTNGAQKKRKRAKTSSTSTPAAGPSIELPPSDAPVPPNFLRNQQALLGLAGLVANVDPSSLSTRRHSQGKDPNNPIVVEDEGTTLPRFGHPTAPTPAQLLTTLSAQKELFPVLEQLLNILRRGVDPTTQPPQNPPQPPPKRRKLSRVPAGAADWDVPFPFPPGEGPPNYQEEWTNERCERLISDFVALLREGANKATARTSTKRANSQPAPRSSTQSNPTSARSSVPPTNNNLRSHSNYVPLPPDAYLRPTLSHNYTATSLTPLAAGLQDPSVDLLTSIFGAVMPPQDSDLSIVNSFGPPMDSLPPGFDIDPLLLSLMGTGPPQEESNGMGSPASSSQEVSTPALSHSPDPSRSTASGPSPMTPNFLSSSLMCDRSPLGTVASQEDRVGFFGLAPHLGSQDGAYFCQGGSLYEDLMGRGMFTGMELGMDVDGDFSDMFGMEEDAPCETSVASQPPHFSDTLGMVPLPFHGLELSSQGVAGQAVLPVNTHTPGIPLPSPILFQGAPDISTFLAPQQDPLPSSSNTLLPIPATTSLQRQRPVPKRPTPEIPPSKGKAAATLAVAKKRREDTIQQARDLKRQLLADIGKSKVQLWELTMEQGVLTRMSKDGRLKES